MQPCYGMTRRNATWVIGELDHTKLALSPEAQQAALYGFAPYDLLLEQVASLEDASSPRITGSGRDMLKLRLEPTLNFFFW